MAEFVEGWLVAQVLGEGAYGEVRLLVHAGTGAAVALKVSRAREESAREAALQRALRHPHVLRCLGDRTHLQHHYMFLEYAQGGELFDRIEPDAGMRAGAARRYWRQLLLGLRYLHARGVAHRDLKPENLLLDRADTLKISDFGMATVFRVGCNERLMSRVCGTVPYAAPEVLRAAERPYRAPPADLWAAALVLLAMLAGELPWGRAEAGDARYAAWCARAQGAAGVQGAVGVQGVGAWWGRVGRGARALLARALQPEPRRRPPLQALLEHRWSAAAPECSSRAWRSQPAVGGAGGAGAGEGEAGAGVGEGEGEARDLSAADMEALVRHSQPAHADELLLLGTQHDAGAGASQLTQSTVAQRLVRRMTRVWVACSARAALAALGAALRARGHAWRELHPGMLAIECGEVRMRAWAVPWRGAGEGEGEAPALVQFRRSRGCGLQFKRRYLELAEALSALAAPPPPGAALA